MKKFFVLALILGLTLISVPTFAQDNQQTRPRDEGNASVKTEVETPERFKPLLGSWATTGRSWTVVLVRPNGEVVLRNFVWNGPNPKVTARALIGDRGEARLVLSIPSDQWATPLVTDLGCASASCDIMVGKNIYTPAYQTDAKAYRQKN